MRLRAGGRGRDPPRAPPAAHRLVRAGRARTSTPARCAQAARAARSRRHVRKGRLPRPDPDSVAFRAAKAAPIEDAARPRHLAVRPPAGSRRATVGRGAPLGRSRTNRGTGLGRWGSWKPRRSTAQDQDSNRGYGSERSYMFAANERYYGSYAISSENFRPPQSCELLAVPQVKPHCNYGLLSCRSLTDLYRGLTNDCYYGNSSQRGEGRRPESRPGRRRPQNRPAGIVAGPARRRTMAVAVSCL